MNPGELQPVVQRTRSEEAAEQLRAAIKHGQLTPGSRLVERDLAQRLGMSRIPVREAIQRLIEEGLVTKEPHRGTFVYTLSQPELEEISSLRVVLEQFVVVRVLERWNAGHETRLREIVAAMHSAAAHGDLQKLSDHDAQFHYTLWAIADHGILLEVVSGLRSRIGRFLHEATSSLPASDLFNHAAAHTDLIDVLRSGNEERARSAIAEHITQAKQRILNYYKQRWAPTALPKS